MKINRGINQCLHKILILCDRIRLLLNGRPLNTKIVHKRQENI